LNVAVDAVGCGTPCWTAGDGVSSAVAFDSSGRRSLWGAIVLDGEFVVAEVAADSRRGIAPSRATGSLTVDLSVGVGPSRRWRSKRENSFRGCGGKASHPV
jgi:hypothetical protein